MVFSGGHVVLDRPDIVVDEEVELAPIQSLKTKARIPVASSRKKMRPRNTENWWRADRQTVGVRDTGIGVATEQFQPPSS